LSSTSEYNPFDFQNDFDAPDLYNLSTSSDPSRRRA